MQFERQSRAIESGQLPQAESSVLGDRDAGTQFEGSSMASTELLDDSRAMLEVYRSLSDTERELMDQAIRYATATQNNYEGTREEFEVSQRRLGEKKDERGFREKYLRGWFGGDRELVRDIRHHQRGLENLGATLEGRERIAKNRARERNERIDGVLQAQFSDFAELKLDERSLGEIRKSLLNLQLAIFSAESQVDSAQSWEVIDLTGNNIGFSLLSHEESNDAIADSKEVNFRLEQFEECLTAHQDRTGIRTDALSSKQLDFFDFFGGMGFMSVFRMGELDKIEDWLGQLKMACAQIEGQIDVESAEIDEQLNGYRSEFISVAAAA